MALFVSDITSACFCMISRHYQVYSSTTEYQRAFLTILPTENYNLPFMGHKIPYLSSLLVTCHQSSRLYGVFKLAQEKHRVASTPELATNFIDYKQMAGMTMVRKNCYYTVLSRRYALRWIYFNLNIFIFEIYTQQ